MHETKVKTMLKRKGIQNHRPSMSGKTDFECQRNRATSPRGVRPATSRRHDAGSNNVSAAQPDADKTRKIIRIPIASIAVPKESREIDEDKVSGLAEGIKEIGLQAPIEVRPITFLTRSKHRWILISGNHRIEALKLLGKKYVDVMALECSKDEARQRTIGENLFRSDLTVLQRAEHIVEWGQLCKGAQSEHPSRGGKQPHDTGVSRIARGLGISRSEVWRWRKIAAIDSEAKEAAKAAGLDNSQIELLAIAKERTPKAQLAKVRELENKEPMKRKSEKSDPKTLPGNEESPTSAKEKKQSTQDQSPSTQAALVNAWKRAKTLNKLWAGATIADRENFIAFLKKIPRLDDDANSDE
jgi:ParB/RepB/Spo0J family partition protein